MANSLDHLANRTRLEWLSGLNTEFRPAKNFRRTSIIGTIGPKTNSVEKINLLRSGTGIQYGELESIAHTHNLAGLNVVRMNFSHGAYEYHQSVVDHAKEAERVQSGRPLAVALDTKGPEIRTGNTPDDQDIPIAEGAEMNITTDEKYATASDNKNMYVDYKNITKVIEKGRTVYVDDGVLSFEVLDLVDDKTIRVRCMNNGKISSKKGVNLPKTDVDLPALSEKDQEDLRFGVKNKVDMVFASFIRRGSDITAIREVLGEGGKEIQIIAKIENQQGVNNFDEILKETDGVMVARGDLGIEIPPAQVFIAQKMMIAKCNLAGKPVICATQMLESMTYNPRPTRAEVSDVGNAVLDGADCVMLSGETAKGNYPRESVMMMHEACLLAEIAIPYVSLFDELRSLAPRPTETTESVAMAAVSASLELNAGAILTLTTTGKTARLISKYRPVCPILMVTRNPTASRYSHLYRGVYPFLFPEKKPDFNSTIWQEDVDRRLKWGIAEAIKLGILEKGDSVVCVQGWRGGLGHTNTIRVVPAEEDLGLARV
ncbi:Pyruvate kinase [Hypocenomyce scalaris]|nr:Pyruvate kinase [Hypocenomyce scalaris]